MEIVISPRNMYQVLFMETLEIVSGIFSGSDFVEVTFSGTTHAPMWKKLWSHWLFDLPAAAESTTLL